MLAAAIRGYATGRQSPLTRTAVRLGPGGWMPASVARSLSGIAMPRYGQRGARHATSRSLRLCRYRLLLLQPIAASGGYGSSKRQ